MSLLGKQGNFTIHFRKQNKKWIAYRAEDPYILGFGNKQTEAFINLEKKWETITIPKWRKQCLRKNQKQTINKKLKS